MAQIPDNWITLPAATVFKVTGEDATSYLQSQVTQNLPSSADPECIYTLWLNERGRIEGDSYILQHGADAFTLLSFHTPPAVLQHCIERHIIADDVETEPQESPRFFQGIPGSDPNREWLEASGFSLPDKGGFSVHSDGRLLFREERGTRPLFLLEFGEADSSRISEPNLEAWTRERIHRKIPAIPAEVGRRDTPFDLDLLEPAVSLTKGCFLGQEVLARLRAQGRSVRRLGIVEGRGLVPQSGEGILSNSKTVGRMLVALGGQEGWSGLAQVRQDLDADQPEALKMESGSEITQLNF